MSFTAPVTDSPTPRFGVLGCGNIAEILARHNLNIEVVAVYDRHSERAEHLASVWDATVCQNFAEFIGHDMDTVVEIASIEAVEDHAGEILQHGKNLILLSVGALADEQLRSRLIETAKQYNCTIRVPSGALFGLDNIKIGRISGFRKLVLRTTKPPAVLGVQTDSRQCLFTGPARECIRRYPKNVNVAVALSLAAGQEAMVELWADPALKQNHHEILVTGEFGKGEIKISNLPSPENPATSYLAALSLITLLNDLGNVLQIGT